MPITQKLHSLETDGQPWPPDAEMPSPVQDLDALLAAAQSAENAYHDAVLAWQVAKEQARLQAWRDYHETNGWPRDVAYKEKIEVALGLRVLEPVILEPVE